MTEPLSELPWTVGEPRTTNGAVGRKCRRHVWMPRTGAARLPIMGAAIDPEWAPVCGSCGRERNPVASRRSRNNGKRGRHAELVVARLIPGGRKMGPLGLPWDVEVGTYARLQVKQLAAKPGPAEIRRLIEAIPDTGDRLRGFVWVEAATHGPLGQAKVVWFLAAEFAQWHGADFGPGHVPLVSMSLADWCAEFVAPAESRP